MGNRIASNPNRPAEHASCQHDFYYIPGVNFTPPGPKSILKMKSPTPMKRTLLIVLLAGLAAIGIAYLFLSHSPRPPSAPGPQAGRREVARASNPAPARATPTPESLDLVEQLPAGASAVVFLNLAALRASPFARELVALAPKSKEDAQYAQFVRETGFDYSRDLNQVALALWPQTSPTSVVALAEGRFNRPKITAYALRWGKRVQREGREIFEMPERDSNRTIRLAFLTPRKIALADGPGIDQVLSRRDTHRLDAAMSARVTQVADAPIFAVAHTDNLPKDLGLEESHAAQLAGMLRSIHTILVAGQPLDGNLKVSASAECDSTLDAFQLSTALEGLLWVGRAALADPKTQQQIGPQWPLLAALLKATDISHDGHSVRARVLVTARMLVAAASRTPKVSEAK